MILHRDGPDRRTAVAPRPASVTELARVLREARVAQGLELIQVSQQTGIPVDQLGDLESGTVDRLPDRVESVKALGRYATFLSLPGDQFVMTLLEHWPAVPRTERVAAVHDTPDGAEPADTLVPASARATAVPEGSTVPASVPSHGAPPGATGPPAVTGRHQATAQVPAKPTDTGPNGAVRRGRDDGPAMVLVRSLVVVALLLVLVGTAWLVVNRVRPHWLVDLHLPNSASPAVASTAQNSPRSTTGTTAAPSPSTPSMRLVSASGTEATFAVTSSSFDVQISASGGETWVQASGPLNSTPGWAGLLTDGESQVVPATQKLVVQIGSIAARIAVRVDQRVIGTYVPPGAPFIMTFTTQ